MFPCESYILVRKVIYVAQQALSTFYNIYIRVGLSEKIRSVSLLLKLVIQKGRRCDGIS